MKLIAVALQNFRGFRAKRSIPVADLTAFVGRNDAGKSTILDALEIFFNTQKLDFGDSNVRSENGDVVQISCVFSDVPSEIVLDANAQTTLADEYLLNADGHLEIAMSWPLVVDAPLPDRTGKVGKLATTCLASHPSAADLDGLLQKKNGDLKKLVKEKGIEAAVNLSSNVSMRRGLWTWGEQNGGLSLQPQEIPLDKEEGKTILEQVRSALPLYMLFRADRTSNDDDSEVQDPLKLAVQEAIREVEAELEAIKAKVQERTLEVAQRTLGKLQDFDADLANELSPSFKAEPKWDSLFKLTLASDDGIPVNKRGSGVRRLVLFSFFRAEAERRHTAATGSNIIYAVEEPETAQHPSYQRMVIEALTELAEDPRSQVLLTTHVPALAGLVPPASVRHVRRDPTGTAVDEGTDDVLRTVANDLGVLPDPVAPGVRAALCVEGKHDIQFLRHINEMMRQHAQYSDLVDISNDPGVIVIMLGGSTLKDWVNEDYLRRLDIREFHIYDRDLPDQHGRYKYQDAADGVNARGNGCVAVLTTLREMENYLHSDAVSEAFSAAVPAHAVTVVVGDHSDVEGDVKAALGGRNRVDRRTIKDWLNNDAAQRMTLARLQARGGEAEVAGWFRTLATMLA